MRLLIASVVLIAACGAPVVSAPETSAPPSTPTSAPGFASPTVVATATATSTRAVTATPTATPLGSQTANPSATTTSTAPPAGSPTLIPLPNTAVLSAPNGTVLWAVVAGDHLFRSLDRGSTWESRPWPATGPATPGAGLNIVTFIDDREGWLLKTQLPGSGCGQDPYALWHTIDAGTSWSRLGPESDFDGPLFAQCKRSIVFADPLRGVVTSVARDMATWVRRTTDGGKTWSEGVALPAPPGFTLNGNGDQGVMPGQPRWFGSTILVDAQGTVSGELQRWVFRSIDSGATWTIAATTPGAVGAFATITTSRWLQIGAPGEHQETTDGGTSWHRYASDYSQAAPIAPQIVFGDENVGYATVRGAIQRTTDGGAHWTTIKTPGT